MSLKLSFGIAPHSIYNMEYIKYQMLYLQTKIELEVFKWTKMGKGDEKSMVFLWLSS